MRLGGTVPIQTFSDKWSYCIRFMALLIDRSIMKYVIASVYAVPKFGSI